MEETLNYLYLRIKAMQEKINKLEKVINELNNQFLVDQNIDIKQLKK